MGSFDCIHCCYLRACIVNRMSIELEENLIEQNLDELENELSMKQVSGLLSSANFLECKNPSIYNILHWVAWMMGQTNR